MAPPSLSHHTPINLTSITMMMLVVVVMVVVVDDQVTSTPPSYLLADTMI